MGSPWKMPTKNQCQELINNTTSIWTTINKVNGYKFTNKTDTSKYIFLQAGGYWNNANHYSDKSSGYYLTTKWSDVKMVDSLYFKSTIIAISTNVTGIYCGLSVRAII